MFLLRVRGAFVCFLLRLRGGGGAHSGRGCVLVFFPVGPRQGSGGAFSVLRVQIKIPWQWVSCAEQRWWTFIYKVVLKRNGLGWAWQYQCQTMNRLKTAAWLSWGRIGLAWPLKKLAWLGLAWFQRGWGVGGTLQLSGCDVQFLRYFVCVCGAMALCVHGSIWERLRLQTRLGASCVK